VIEYKEMKQSSRENIEFTWALLVWIFSCVASYSCKLCILIATTLTH